jgi:hypothetical protein
MTSLRISSQEGRLRACISRGFTQIRHMIGTWTGPPESTPRGGLFNLERNHWRKTIFRRRVAWPCLRYRT